MFKIMIIEDDDILSSLIKDILCKYGYEVYLPINFRDLEEDFKTVQPDLTLLDINLPYYDGFYICKLFRRISKSPIIFISARNSTMDQIMGMEIGADDFITKPFNLEILLSKIKSILRRSYGDYCDNNVNRNNSNLFYADEKSFKIFYKERSIEFTKTEFKLIKKLLENKNEIVCRDILLNDTWGDIYFTGDNALSVNITRIKLKLSDLGINDIIKTKRGLGYMLDTSVLEDDNHE